MLDSIVATLPPHLRRTYFRVKYGFFNLRESVQHSLQQSLTRVVGTSGPPLVGTLYPRPPLITMDIRSDGAGDKRSTKTKNLSPVASIFVHAGAGYHSTHNERLHLAACDAYVLQNLIHTGTH